MTASAPPFPAVIASGVLTAFAVCEHDALGILQEKEQD
jgi:hypothetical protein